MAVKLSVVTTVRPTSRSRQSVRSLRARVPLRRRPPGALDAVIRGEAVPESAAVGAASGAAGGAAAGLVASLF
jgi:hypothetical protein